MLAVDLSVQLIERIVQIDGVRFVEVFTLCDVDSSFQIDEIFSLMTKRFQTIAYLSHICRAAFPKERGKYVAFNLQKPVLILAPHRPFWHQASPPLAHV